MQANVKVVDASVLAALLFGEPRSGEAAALLQDCRLVGPTLLRYEIGSVCAKKMQRYPNQRGALAEALRLFDQMDLQEMVVPVGDAVALACGKRLSVYDAAYLWLATTLEADLVTFDDELRRASMNS